MTFDVDVARMELRGRPVLEGVRFQVEAGERVVLLGVNGCGKTTLLKLLDGLAFPTAGQIRYGGRPLDARALSERAFRRTFRGEVGLLFQSVDAMLFNPTVADEIAFGPRQLGVPEPEVAARVALAAVLAVGPRVLLLDEPTAGLDPASAGRLVDLLSDLTDLTVISATHHLSVAEELGTRAILLAPGRPGALHDGPTAPLLADERLLIESGLAHRHVHAHGAALHAHYHVHDTE